MGVTESLTIPTKTVRARQLGWTMILGWGLGIVKYLLLIVLAISFLLPLFWMVTSALKDQTQIFQIPPIWIPSFAHWNNFGDAWTTLNFSLYLINTVVRYAVPSTLGTVLSSVIVAYGFAKIRWPGRDVIFFICMATMMVPSQVRMVPLFITFKQLGWLNSYKPLVVPAYFGDPFFIFLFRQFFKSFPEELSDAARIDGAGEFRILVDVILPLSKPALTVVVLFSFINAWNDYFGPLIYLSNESLFPLALGIARLNAGLYELGFSRNSYPYLMAVSTLVTVPIISAFFLAQRFFIQGITLTGLKG